MAKGHKDLRPYGTAYEARDALPGLSGWLSDDALKRLPIWQGSRFEAGRTYFDLDNPARGAFAATGDEAPPTDFTYVAENEVPPDVWVLLITWERPLAGADADTLDHLATAAQNEPR